MMLAEEPVPEHAFTLSTVEFDVLIEHLELDRIPLVLKVPSPGRTHTERAEIVDRSWRAMHARGLGRPTNLDSELERMLRLLARPHREVDGRIWLGRSVRVLAASDGDSPERAVLAIKDGDQLTLRTAAASGLPREAASVLPPLPPGPGRSVALRSADLDEAAGEAGDDLGALAAALSRRGIRADDIDMLTRMIGEARSRGQFGTAARNQHGRRARAERVIGFFDTPQGRYVQLRRASIDGDAWSTIAPADTRRLVGHLEELHSEVAADR